MPDVDPFENNHAGIVPETRVQMAVAHIHGDHVSRPSPKETIGKPAGARPDVEADLLLDIDAEGIEGGPELHAPTTDERMLRTGDGHSRFRFDQSARLIDPPAIHPHLASEDQSPCALSAFNQRLVHQALIQTLPHVPWVSLVH
jgi:hypothetical protein